ncbi:MAG: FAD-binding protein [Lachnospiraceae bacterium]|nr:FAD-binding protein [Lachnospiraceae bacterium]
MGQEYKEIRKSCDILIVGGGISGLTAAVSAKEKNPDASVIIVEKQTAGYGGKANKGGGVLQWFDPHMNPDDFLAYHVHSVGCYLGDQIIMRKYIAMNNEMIERMDGWGIKVPRQKIPTGPMTFMVGIDLDNCLKMAQRARKLGCEIIDKVPISDLLTDGNKVSGAVGYSLLDGTWYVFEAKAVLLATGSQNYRVSGMWSNGRGDGIYAAYKAGAEMRNPEFGSFMQLFGKESYHERVFGENNMYNRLGENVTKNFRRFPESDISATAIREWYDQMQQGKGPIYLRVNRENSGTGGMENIWDRPYGQPFWKYSRAEGEGKDLENEVFAGLVGEQSPIKVGHNMDATLEGLYATGDCSYTGSGAPGAVPAPPGRNRGSGILNGIFAGIVGGEAAAEFVKTATQGKVCENQIAKLKEDAYAPLNRAEGTDPIDVIDLVQEVMCPAENSCIMSEHRLNICLRKIAAAKELAKNLKAVDFHGMLSCHEAEAMVFSCEMHVRASLMRKESRGWFFREDYPTMDNENWLKWIIVKKGEDGEMNFSTEDIPIETYPVQPLKFEH